MTVWMEITTDRYKLPVVVADTMKELAKLSGVNTSTITRRSKLKAERFIKVEIDDD